MSILNPLQWNVIDFPADQKPLLVVVIDAEEDFDWKMPLSNSSASVDSIAHQYRVQEILERYGIRPTYVVDYPVAHQEKGFKPLREWMEAGRCDIGAHLHPWVNPPLVETMNSFNTYPGNLSFSLHREKLRVLTEEIEANFGVRPCIHKAGRNGVGLETAAILKDMGYKIDVSVVPTGDMRQDGGPDFRRCISAPYWFDQACTLLELPLSSSIIGALAREASALYSSVSGPLGNRAHLPGLLSRLRLLDRIKLTPEGITLDEARRLVSALLASGQRVYVLSFHSPSVVPGNTPYVRNDKDLGAFLNWIDKFCAFFMGTIGGRPATCTEVYEIARTLPVVSAAPDEEIKKQVRSTLQALSMSLYKDQPIRNWPAWVGRVYGIKLPSNVTRKAEPSPSGAANINIILDLLEQVKDIEGDIAECGVYRGATIATLAYWCQQTKIGRRLIGFDSFEGFDHAIDVDARLGGEEDPQRRAGGFSDTSIHIVQEKLSSLGVAETVQLVKGYFRDTLQEFSGSRFSFIHLDCDIYASYKECLEFFYPRMAPGGIILMDEYNDPSWPGCNKAVDEFMADKPEALQMIERDNYQKFFIVRRLLLDT